MRNTRSEGGFLDFLKSRPRLLKAAAVLLLGLFLLLFGRTGANKSKTAAAVPTLEDRLEEACSSLDSVGECSVMISYGEEGEVVAVLVLCEGADNVEVRADIKSLCGTLFGIGTNRVSVLKIQKENR